MQTPLFSDPPSAYEGETRLCAWFASGGDSSGPPERGSRVLCPQLLLPGPLAYLQLSVSQENHAEGLWDRKALCSPDGQQSFRSLDCAGVSEHLSLCTAPQAGRWAPGVE